MNNTVLSAEFKILRLLSNVTGLTSIESMENIPELKISDLKKLDDDGLIAMADGFVQITEDGQKRFESLVKVQENNMTAMTFR